MSDTDYTITFAPNQIGKMHVCNVKILSRGKHVCIDNEPIITFVSNPDNSTYDSASIQLGNIINWGPVGSTVQVDDNMVIISIIGVNFWSFGGTFHLCQRRFSFFQFLVEVTLGIANDDSVSVGDTLVCNVDLVHTVSQTLSDTASLSVVSTPSSVSIFKIY